MASTSSLNYSHLWTALLQPARCPTPSSRTPSPRCTWSSRTCPWPKWGRWRGSSCGSSRTSSQVWATKTQMALKKKKKKLDSFCLQKRSVPPVLRSRSRYFFGRSRSRCKDVKAKTCFYYFLAYFIWKGAGAGEKKVPGAGAGAGQKWTGSATPPRYLLSQILSNHFWPEISKYFYYFIKEPAVSLLDHCEICRILHWPNGEQTENRPSRLPEAFIEIFF